MPRRFPRQKCKRCGGDRAEVGPISARGNCLACATELQGTAIAEISQHQGPSFHHWRRQMAASVGARLPDDDRLPA